MAKAKAPAAAGAAPTIKPKVDRAARNKKRMEYAAAHPPKVARGTARANRRAKAAQGYNPASNNFPEVWAEFRKNEGK